MQIGVWDIYKDAFHTTVSRWRVLLSVTAVPIGIMVLVAALSGWLTGAEIAGLSRSGAAPTQQELDRIGQGQWWADLGTGVASAWLMLRATRWYLPQRNFPAISGELISFVIWFLYGIAILLMLALPAGIAVTGLLLAGMSLAAPPPMAVTIVLALAGIAYFVAALYAGTRFTLAMPAVMLGNRPHMFRQMWPFAKPIAWRFLGIGVLVVIALGIVVGLFVLLASGPFIGFYGSLIESGAFTPLYQAVLTVVLLVIGIPLYWYQALVIAEGFARLADMHDRPGEAAAHGQ